MVNYGGTFLESEVNELRAMRKVVIFSFLLIPYWMIYTQVKLTKSPIYDHEFHFTEAITKWVRLLVQCYMMKFIVNNRTDT